MNPEIALVVLLTIVCIRPFFELPNARAKTVALKAAGYKPEPMLGCLYVLLIPTMLSLWWWYALATDQVLLGVLPTVGAVMTAVVAAFEHAVAKGATR